MGTTKKRLPRWRWWQWVGYLAIVGTALIIGVILTFIAIWPGGTWK